MDVDEAINSMLAGLREENAELRVACGRWERRVKVLESRLDAIATGRIDIDDALRAEIDAAERALWDALFPRSAVPECGA